MKFLKESWKLIVGAIGFILGLSFISGSILGSTMRIDFNKNIK